MSTWAKPGYEGEMTLAEVGKALGVSRARIMQIEQAALQKLRRACKREGIDLAAICTRLDRRG